MHKNRTNHAEQPFLPATANERGLAVFVLGSIRSRAAARALLAARREAEQPQMKFVISSIVDGKEIDFAAFRKSSENVQQPEIRRVLVAPDAKTTKPRPPQKPHFDGPVRVIVDRKSGQMLRPEASPWYGAQF